LHGHGTPSQTGPASTLEIIENQQLSGGSSERNWGTRSGLPLRQPVPTPKTVEGGGHPRNTAEVTDVKNTKRGALLLIDFQQDFLAPNGRMPVDQSQVQPAIEAAHRAVDEASDKGDLILKIGNEFRQSDVIGNLFRHHAAIKGSIGAKWDGRIDPPEATYVPKWKSDAFCNPDLMALLEEEGVGQVRLTGLYAKACITATAKGGRKRGLSVQVIGDATACGSDKSRQAALDKLRRIGIKVL
jgi:nicotinamidase-related amidase